MLSPDADRNSSTITLEPRQPDPEQEISIHWVIENYHDSVFRYAFRLTGNSNDAEDLCQQSFLMAHQRLDQLRDSSRCLSWMFTIVRNTFFKMNRRQRPACAANLELDVDQVQEPEKDEPLFDSECLQLAFDRLEPEHRVILMMFYFEQLSYREIADKLELKIGTVMSRLSRAKSKLRGGLLHAEEGISNTKGDSAHE